MVELSSNTGVVAYMPNLEALASYQDFRDAAKRQLPRILFDYIDGGSYQESTLLRNEQDFQALQLEQRILKDMSNVSSDVSLFGQQLSMPVILAPVGFSGMFARRGEVQAARAAKYHNIPFSLSTVGICSIEEVSMQSGSPPWFQLYMIKDRGWMATLLQRAQKAGCKVLYLTCDLQTPGARYRDVRSGMRRRLTMLETLKRGLEGLYKLPWVHDVWFKGRPHTFGNLDGVLPQAASFDQAWDWISNNFDPSVTWQDLDFIRLHWQGPIVVKGVMTIEDAKLAVDNNIDGIVVSNHGGRQLDSTPSTISVLPDIADAVGNDLTVLVDSGVRSGLDVLKAQKLGAKACLIGRPWAYGLAAGGEKGVRRVLDLFKAELNVAQVLSGKQSL